jgi:XTP/dITP diphosphohydrolase
LKPLLLATRNKGKLKEIETILGGGVPLMSLDDYPDAPEVAEDRDTFEGNAIKKAAEVADATGEITLADDSGLEVDTLDGAPGVYSARFSGEGATDESNNEKLLSLVKGVPEVERTARFRCVIAVVTPGGEAETTSAVWEGYIVDEPRGKNGFGYDPLFFSPEHGATSAELPPAKKNRVSHRGQALRAAKSIILDILSD